MSKVIRPLRSLKRSDEDFTKSVRRIIDANLNRSMEGLRVCEEFTRFILENSSLTAKLKQLRHSLISALKKIGLDSKILSEARDSAGDVGKESILSENKRSSLRAVILSNLQRVKESLRVLEEYLKIDFNPEDIKKLRFKFYAVEKEIIKRL